MAALHASRLALAVPIFQMETVHVDVAVEEAQEIRYAPPLIVPGIQVVLKQFLVGCQALMMPLPARQLSSSQEARVAVVPAGGVGGVEVGGITSAVCRGGDVMVVPTLAAALLVQSTTADPPPML